MADKKESFEVKFNRLVPVARKMKADLVTANTRLESVDEENLTLMSEATKLTAENEKLKKEITELRERNRRVVKLMKMPNQESHHLSIRVANILCPINES